jgi:chemotaxis protein methyltransferase CheR
MSVAVLSPVGGDDYVDFCVGINRLVGIDLLQYKRGQMERRLRSFAERRGTARLTEYLTVLRDDATELERFLDRVTINVSQLWRNPEQWATLGRSVVPELAKNGRIRIWSAGCSYGAEAYTIAAVCIEHAPGVRVEVNGTDVDQRMVERARKGVFSVDDARTVPAASLDRWFERVADGWQARPELQKTVSFDRGDLLTMRFPTAAYDLVLCRNVVIYFTEDVRDALHGRLATSLRGGGYLVVGATERVAAASEIGVELTAPFTYRKVA